MKYFIVLCSVLLWNCSGSGDQEESGSAAGSGTENAAEKNWSVIVGAERVGAYLPQIQKETIALVVNQTSMVGKVHLADTLHALGVNIKAIFAPEHGFRGEADAGAKIEDGRDPRTGIPLISLYGSKRQPTPQDLAGVDRVIFDIQDVGARFYTYISTMHYVMQACAENGVAFTVLDRPNPNGHYVDGPVRRPEYQSFVGMDPIPVVHGMTVGELAQMINGEGWLEGGVKCELSVITCENYGHNTFYELPVPPSPNLPNMHSIYLYPSLCFFEGTVASVGRGTNKQFQVIGYPGFPGGYYTFTPTPRPGAMEPKLLDQECKGYDLSSLSLEELRQMRRINLSYLINFYREFQDKPNFFLKNNWIDKLAGTPTLREQIVAGMSEAEIRSGWTEEISAFLKKREKYLLYE